MSEFSLIHTHFKHLTVPHQATLLGIGDDCAVSQIPPNHQLVGCVDTLVAGRHFPLSTSPFAIGYKSVAVNLSDLAAMGATPYAILLGLSLPTDLANDEAWIKKFTRGIGDICTTFDVDLIGGDTTKSDILTISVTALGFVPNGQAITRHGATVGDVVCVSGEIGSASFALQQVLQNQTSDLQHTLDLPMPQVALGQKLRGFASSMIDISDGLGQDLGHILNASDVGAAIDLAKIPCHSLLQSLLNDEKWQHQINGGDDYQLCFTMPSAKLDLFKKQNPDMPIYPIGQIVADKGLVFLHNKKQVNFKVQGWEHF